MTIALSLSFHSDRLWVAGPDGFFHQGTTGLTPVIQPQVELSCCLVTNDFLLVGGAPHGVAYSRDGGVTWQAGWMEGATGRVLCLAASPDVSKNGVLLAGSQEDGIWRSRDTGRSWKMANVGLHAFAIFCLAWAPPAPPQRWPTWDVVFAGAEQGLYRSPNGGRAWKKCDGVSSVIQCIAVAPDFHLSESVFAGAEADGLWRSVDGGRSFQPVPGAPQQINALTALSNGWLLSDDEGLWHSRDGENWHALPETAPTLVLLDTPQGVWAGGFDGVSRVEIPAD